MINFDIISSIILFISSGKDVDKISILHWKTHKLKDKQSIIKFISQFICHSDEDIDHYSIYNWFIQFMNLPVLRLFKDADFLILEWCLGMLSLLLMYHDPEVVLQRRYCMISWDIYVFNCFIRLYTSKQL